MRRLAVPVLAVALLPAAAFAQQVIRAAGVVRDDSGTPVRGAVITAINPDNTPPRITTTSNDKGQFGVIGIRRGTWTFRIDAPGYESTSVQRLVSGTRPPPIDVRLAKNPAAARPLDDVRGSDIQQRIDRAEALAASGDLDAAIAEWRAILVRVPALTMVHLRIGELLERKADSDAALAAYRTVLENDPANARARAALERLSRKQ
jgi:hypothetical protein